MNEVEVKEVNEKVVDLEEIKQRKKQEIDKSIQGGTMAKGILDIHPDGYGFIRSNHYLSGENDVYISQTQIRRFQLKTGDLVCGYIREAKSGERFSALMLVTAINGVEPNQARMRKSFEELTPIFPNERIRLSHKDAKLSMRIMDLLSPIGKGQRGMIVSPPKSGKTTLLKEVALSMQKNNPEIYLIILLIDERPEEVTDIKEAIVGERVEVVASTFDELPESHKKLSEMVIERAKRLVEQGEDVIILLDSITRLSRAYNLTITPSGRTLSGGLDPAALHMPKRFFGAARNTRESGSLTILATALVETGSKMDDVIFEEFKGTGNMELVLSRKLQERRIFPAIDLLKSGTRKEDLLLDEKELLTMQQIRKLLNGFKAEQAVDNLLSLFEKTASNDELVEQILQ
ncbi:MAG: transcription termination factor Rho [Erysipelotrichia bacterium]|nr:transcription termination factor Rho [Erysipelotrichia bacterium]